jgi:hypothetical protein
MTLHEIHPAPGYDNTHECPHRRCAERVHPEKYACPPHTLILPPVIRHEIEQAERFGDKPRRWAAECEADRWMGEHTR